MHNTKHVPLVEITRGGIVESIHFGSLCLSNPDGNIILSLGDLNSPFFLRSSAKPFQALAFLERGGIDHYDLEPREIAIMCASHSGTPEHIKVLENLQQKTGTDESLLQCGVHAPYHQESADALKRAGIEPHANHNNCSGKHTAMLSFAKMIGAPLDCYLESGHPVQRAILQTFSEMCGIDPQTVIPGVDGCTAPVFAVPLPAAARGYARMSQPVGLPEKRAEACQTIISAMQAHADMVAGPNRFDTEGMFAGKGAFFCKIGAEGYRGLGILPSKTRGFSEGLGMACKISDGDLTYRARPVIAMAVLKALGELDKQQLESLKHFDRRPVTNWRGKEVGEIRPSKELYKALKILPKA